MSTAEVKKEEERSVATPLNIVSVDDPIKKMYHACGQFNRYENSNQKGARLVIMHQKVTDPKIQQQDFILS